MALTASASLDKATYNAGDVATLTVSYSNPSSAPMSITVTLTDAEGNSSNPVTVSAVVDPSQITIADSSGHTWTKQSDTGTVAVYTTTV